MLLCCMHDCIMYLDLFVSEIVQCGVLAVGISYLGAAVCVCVLLIA